MCVCADDTCDDHHVVDDDDVIIVRKINIDSRVYIKTNDGNRVLEWSPTLQFGVLQHSLHILNLMRSPITIQP